MQRFIPAAVVMGALIVAGALLFHGFQLAEVARRLEAMEHRTGGLDDRLNTFSEDLPSIISQAGREAGQQAVQGVLDEVVRKPFRRVTGTGGNHKSNATAAPGSQPGSLEHAGGEIRDEGAPLIRFDIREPVVNVEVLGNLEELSSFLRSPAEDGKEPAGADDETAGKAESSEPKRGTPETKQQRG